MTNDPTNVRCDRGAAPRSTSLDLPIPTPRWTTAAAHWPQGLVAAMLLGLCVCTIRAALHQQAGPGVCVVIALWVLTGGGTAHDPDDHAHRHRPPRRPRW